MNKKGSKHIKWEQRLTIERMLKEGFSKPDIAKAIGVCERSVYYEISRGMCIQQTSDYIFEERYCPEVAERKYQEHLRAKGPELKIGKDHALANYIEHMMIDEQYSPGAVLHLIEEQELPFETRICETTLYSYIYREDVFLNLNKEHLLYKGNRKSEKDRDRQKRSRAAKGTSIEQRDPEIKERNTFGHWELDSVMGTVGSDRALLVFTERLTRMGIVIPVPDHTAASVVRAVNRLERRFGRRFYSIFRSITVDNGCEFMDCEGIEKSCRRKGARTKVYYCHPCSPHERGSNENMNRILRRFFPKGTNFDQVDDAEIRRAEMWMNSYPRRVLGWKSSKALFDLCLTA